MAAELIHGCCLQEMAAMKAAGRTVQSVITDPPYGLHFMGAKWDAPDNIAFRAETWRLAYDLLEPGGMMAAFGGSRTHHRIMCAIEDAGFEIRDCLLWLHSQGFPKSKALLKPSYEPIILARKPGPLRPLAIDSCRVNPGERVPGGGNGEAHNGGRFGAHETSGTRPIVQPHDKGRWPPNCLTDGSPEVLAAFARFGERGARGGDPKSGSGKRARVYGAYGGGHEMAVRNDTGSAARYFPALGYSDDDELRFHYCAKASRRERGEGNTHSTVKPLSLMRWLVRLINPPGGVVLDMFSGSGTTGLACLREGFDCVLVERELEYCQMARKRLGLTFELEAAD